MQVKTIDRILVAIDELKAAGVKTTTDSIADHIGLTQQRIHQVLKKENALHLLDSIQKRESRRRMVAKLEELGTDQLAISDIKELPIEGLSGLSHMQLNGLISGYKVPHAGSKLDKLRQIDTAQYTAEELHEMTDPESNFRGFRDILYLNKIPFKPSEKVLKSSLEIFKRMGKIDTSRHTLEELYGMSGSQGTMSEFRRTIQKYKVRYKNEILGKRQQ